MPKILDTNDLLDAAHGLPQYSALLQKAEAATKAIADALAAYHGITVTDVSYQGGFGGLCATFKPAHPGQPCPEDIDSGDPGGDWED